MNFNTSFLNITELILFLKIGLMNSVQEVFRIKAPRICRNYFIFGRPFFLLFLIGIIVVLFVEGLPTFREVSLSQFLLKTMVPTSEPLV